MLKKAPSISIRVSIRFLPVPPDEPTSTIVLNGGSNTNLFTDFRPLLSDPTRCEWAFAGVKRYLGDGRCVWDHLVDNRSFESGTQASADVGHCQVLDNGDECETGMMMNTATGKVEEYEEIWRDEPVPIGTRVVVLQLRSKNAEHSETRGIFVLVGGWAQSVVKGDLGVYARRWRFSEEWQEAAAYGESLRSMPFPQGSVLSATTVVLPEDEVYDDEEWSWEVAEDYVWASQ